MMIPTTSILLLPLFLLSSFLVFSTALQIGAGIADVTGPIGGINMLGYAKSSQSSGGVWQRQRARCFVFIHENRVVYCSVDVGMMSTLVKRRVLVALERRWPGEFTEENVLLSATHTHSAPGGFMEYFLYSITGLGFIEDSARRLVDGLVESIDRARRSVRDASMRVAHTSLYGASRNRSPSAYMANPESLRRQFPSDIDTEMTQLSFLTNNTLFGLLNLFPVHGTSLNNTNRLVSGDNKGYASWLMESWLNGRSPFTSVETQERVQSGDYVVAAFAQSAAGDVTPNTEGAYCLDTGLACDGPQSGCPNAKGELRNELCHARGPKWEEGDQASAKEIGLRQFVGGRALLESSAQDQVPVDVIDFRHMWLPISGMDVHLPNGTVARTCLPARGYSFAAGTTDGPGEFDFLQSDNSTGKPWWNMVKQVISKPSAEQVRCHWPKPILLNTGPIERPYLWEPRVVDIQLLRLGTVIMAALPAEFSTMAARLLRQALAAEFGPQFTILLSAISNSYSGYVTTYDEYQVQRYEGASTIYGPHTLSAYIQGFRQLARHMLTKQPTDIPLASQPPPDFSDKLLTFLPPVLLDAVPLGQQFGSIVPGLDVSSTYTPNRVASCTFFSGHPRSFRGTHIMSVERYIGPPLEHIQQAVEAYLKPLGAFGAVSVKARSNHFLISATEALSMSAQSHAFSQRHAIQRRRHYFLTVNNATSIWPSHQQALADMRPLWEEHVDEHHADTWLTWFKPLGDASPISHLRVHWRISGHSNEQHSNEQHSIKHSSIKQQVFRFRYWGAHKALLGGVREHDGQSAVFTVHSLQ